MVSNLLASLADLVTPWHDFQGTNLSVRGNGQAAPESWPLELPLVPARGAAIAAGRRDFAMAWLGGTPPFRLELAEAASGRLLFEAGELAERALLAREVTLPVGAYTLRLIDAAGGSVERPLDAVQEDQVPQPPPEPVLTRLQASWRTTAEAAWLAQQGSGRWLLETYVRVVPVAAVLEPARLLADLLAAGGPVGQR